MNRTPESDFEIPILRVLAELGGRADMRELLPCVERETGTVLTPDDYEQLPVATEIRWWNTAKFARKHMVDDGRLRKGSDRFIWEITDAGRAFLGIAGPPRRRFPTS